MACIWSAGDITRKRIAKHWDLFFAVTALMRNPQHKQLYPEYAENGVAAYLSNSLTFGNTFMLIEGKYYDNYTVAKDTAATTVQYTAAPTLERADSDHPGGQQHRGRPRPRRADAAQAPASSCTRTTSATCTPSSTTTTCSTPTSARWLTMPTSACAGATSSAARKCRPAPDTAGRGFQREREPGVDPYTRKLPHADIYFSKQIGTTRGLAHSVNARVEWRYEHKQLGDAPAKAFHRGNVVLGYGMSPWFTVAFIGGFSSEFPALDGQLHEQPCIADVDSCLFKPHLWPGGEVRINFLRIVIRALVRRSAGRRVVVRQWLVSHAAGLRGRAHGLGAELLALRY